jgi:hypothetical protein
MKRFLLILAACSLCFVGQLAAADIVALCIGNNAYVTPEDVLDTPVNDARLMHQTLRAVPGVQAADIVLLEDAKRSQITLALRQFKARAEGAKLALIFYSGHGVEDTPTGYDRAETFLLPVDAVIDSADDLPDKAVPLKTVLEALDGTRGAARGVILDCCRSGAPGATKSLARAGKNLSALDESVKKALGGAILPEGTLIAFAASPGRKAAAFLTEADMNSPFTRFISEQMSTQGGDLFSIVNAASRITKQRTEMRQVPHVELRGDASLITDFAIPASSLVKLTTPETTPAMTEAEIERRVRELAARMAVETAMQNTPAPETTTPALSSPLALQIRHENGFPKDVGNVIALMPDGTTEMWTKMGGAMKARVGPEMLSGWTFGKNDYKGTWVNSNLRVLKGQTVVANIEAEKPFIEEWRFMADAKTVVLKSRALHGAAVIELYDIGSGKKISRVDAFAPRMPEWAAPFSDEPSTVVVEPSSKFGASAPP